MSASHPTLTMSGYLPRIAENEIESALRRRGAVCHYRDSTDLEADVVIERLDGTWIAAEIKLNTSPKAVDKAAKSLLRLKEKVARPRVANLASLLIVTPTGPAYRRPDGIQVAPITALAP